MLLKRSHKTTEHCLSDSFSYVDKIKRGNFKTKDVFVIDKVACMVSFRKYTGQISKILETIIDFVSVQLLHVNYMETCGLPVD